MTASYKEPPPAGKSDIVLDFYHFGEILDLFLGGKFLFLSTVDLLLDLGNQIMVQD